MKIREMIVVEGKNDTARLKLCFDCDTIETGGDHVSEETLDRIEAAQKRRGVIVFTDPDTAGEHIRRKIRERVPEAKHAFIPKEKAHTTRKVGVEHAGKADLEEALAHAVTFHENARSLTWEEYLDLGMTGDAQRRCQVTTAFHLGKCNAKTGYRRLNEAEITAEEVREVLYGKSDRD